MSQVKVDAKCAKGLSGIIKKMDRRDSVFCNVDVSVIKDVPLVKSQRPVIRSHIKHLVTEWNPLAVQTLTFAVYPGGKVELLDGQHRREAMLEIGVKVCHVELLPVRNAKQAAEVFKQRNDGKTLSPYAKFHADCVNGCQIALKAKAIAEEHMYSFAYNDKELEVVKIACVKTCLDAVRKLGGQAFERAVEIIDAACVDDGGGKSHWLRHSAFNSNVVAGLSALVAYNRDVLGVRENRLTLAGRLKRDDTRTHLARMKVTGGSRWTSSATHFKNFHQEIRGRKPFGLNFDAYEAAKRFKIS